jgi:chloramphenicol-sensitive protein RarD
MTAPQDFSQHAKDLRNGTWAGVASYGMWGLFPIYWKQVVHVNPVHILCHRVLWSAIFLLAVLWARGALRQLLPIFRHRQSILSVATCAVLITANWGIYIFAVNSGQITESSLGYYITPLLSVALGSLLFNEKMDKWTIAAVLLAALGIALAAAMIGKLPWVSVLLAATFSVYGAVKKKAGLDALTGLAAETIVAAPFAAVWLFWANQAGWGGFIGPDAKSTFFLVLAGPVTAVPLLTFAYGTVRIPLQRMGFIQYFSPTIQLAIGLLLYGEHISPPMLLAFSIVVVAVAVYLGSRKWSAQAAKQQLDL